MQTASQHASSTTVTSRGHRRPRLCFVAPKAFGVLAERAGAHVGGAELQQVLLARALQERGYSVSFVTRDEGQGRETSVDGIRVFATCASQAGVAGLRFIHPRWTSLCAALRRADADIYYQRVAGLETGQVAHWCRRHRREFVFAAAADNDCERTLPALRDPRARWSYRYGLRNAAGVIAQTQRQQYSLRANFGIHATLIRSCTPDPGAVAHPAATNPLRIAWIGRIVREKRLELLLDVAARLPEARFDVVGPWPANDRDIAPLRARAEQLPNVNVRGHVSPAKVGVLLEQAHVLACTSRCEGFPNTFLEAWARGRPVVSTVDPDELIARRGLGAVVQNPDEMLSALRRYARNPQAWHAAGRRAHQHFLATHTIDQAANEYERVLHRLMRERGVAPAVPLQPSTTCAESVEL